MNAAGGVATSASSRNTHGRGWRSKLAVYVLAGTAAGALVGTVLGALGGIRGDELRAAAATLLGLVAIGCGAYELMGGRIRLLRRNRETPQRWLYLGALRWALVNGAALGTAFSTRLGFALYYVVPAGALLSGRAVTGALLYGTYAAVRTAAAYELLVWRGRTADPAEVTDVLRGWQATLRRVTGGIMLLVGCVAVVVVGF